MGSNSMQPTNDVFTCSAGKQVRLRALRWGDSSQPKLILLHGGGANAHWWDHIAPHFADRYSVYALDFRGHGRSEHPEELSSDGFLLDIEALLEHIGSHEVILIGHSMGGRLALQYAAREGRVHALVLVDVPRSLSPRARRRSRLALTLRRTYETREDAVTRYRFLPAARHATEELRNYIAEHSVGEEDDGRFAYRFDPRWFSLPPGPRLEFERVRCRCLVVRGGESELLSREGAEELASELTDAEVCEIAEAGHHVQLDRPIAFCDALDAFLATL